MINHCSLFLRIICFTIGLHELAHNYRALLRLGAFEIRCCAYVNWVQWLQLIRWSKWENDLTWFWWAINLLKGTLTFIQSSIRIIPIKGAWTVSSLFTALLINLDLSRNGFVLIFAYQAQIITRTFLVLNIRKYSKGKLFFINPNVFNFIYTIRLV